MKTKKPPTQYNGTPWTNLLGERVNAVRPAVTTPANRPPCPDYPSGKFYKLDGSVSWGTVRKWEWSTSFNRWGAVVKFVGETIFTYPAL